MSSRFSHNTSFTKFIIVIEFLLVAYLLYSLTKNVYNSYQVDKYIERFESENARILEENRRKTADYLYYTSEEYIDKIAKQNLGLVNPGEEIIVLSSDVLEEKTDAELEAEGEFAVENSNSNLKRWADFFFGEK